MDNVRVEAYYNPDRNETVYGISLNDSAEFPTTLGAVVFEHNFNQYKEYQAKSNVMGVEWRRFATLEAAIEYLKYHHKNQKHYHVYIREIPVSLQARISGESNKIFKTTGREKIKCIKALRNATGMGLTEAKDRTENMGVFGVEDETTAIALDNEIRAYGYGVYRNDEEV